MAKQSNIPVNKTISLWISTFPGECSFFCLTFMENKTLTWFLLFCTILSRGEQEDLEGNLFHVHLQLHLSTMNLPNPKKIFRINLECNYWRERKLGEQNRKLIDERKCVYSRFDFWRESYPKKHPYNYLTKCSFLIILHVKYLIDK